MEPRLILGRNNMVVNRDNTAVNRDLSARDVTRTTHKFYICNILYKAVSEYYVPFYKHKPLFKTIRSEL